VSVEGHAAGCLCDDHWVEAYPEGYYKCNSYFRLLQILRLAMKLKKRVLWVLDEAGALAKGFQKGESAVQSHVRDNASFVSIQRHIAGCTTIYITQALENLGVAYRQLGQLTDMKMTKPPAQQGYSQQELVLFETSEGYTALRTVQPFGLANTKEWAAQHPGSIIYADAVSSFDRGKYPGTNIEFQLRECLDAMSDQLPSKYGGIIEEYLKPPSERRREEGTVKPEASDSASPEQRWLKHYDQLSDEDRALLGPLGKRYWLILDANRDATWTDPEVKLVGGKKSWFQAVKRWHNSGVRPKHKPGETPSPSNTDPEDGPR
jgi:hypothetical protein